MEPSCTDTLLWLAVEKTIRITVWRGSETFIKYTESSCGEQYVAEHGRSSIPAKSIMVNPGEAFMCDPSCMHQVFAPEQRWIVVLVRRTNKTTYTALSQTNVEEWKRPFMLPVV